MMEAIQQILPILPQRLHEPLQRLTARRPEDIRLRAGQAPTALICGQELRLDAQPVTWQELENTLMAATDHSCYAAQEQLREGFVTIAGGHRVGICGTAVVRGGEMAGLRSVSSLCIRIARQINCRAPALAHSTLILGAPGCGKTTLLRACVRVLSYGGARVSVADERGELAACVQGVPQLDVGPCTDVLSGGSKARSMMLLLRAMRPDWIAADEITAPEDLEAIRRCSYCGVRLLATAHAENRAALEKRPLYRELLALGVFDTYIILDGQKNWSMEEAT